jgi:hypothetical protein
MREYLESSFSKFLAELRERRTAGEERERGHFTDTLGAGNGNTTKARHGRQCRALVPTGSKNRRIFAYFHIERHRPSDLYFERV